MALFRLPIAMGYLLARTTAGSGMVKTSFALLSNYCARKRNERRLAGRFTMMTAAGVKPPSLVHFLDNYSRPAEQK
jgi:hypothetical protein